MQQVTCNRQIRGDQAVSLGLIEGFLEKFDDISAEWLLRGEGMSGSMEGDVLGDSTRFSPLLDLRIQVWGTHKLVEYQFSSLLRQPTYRFL